MGLLKKWDAKAVVVIWDEMPLSSGIAPDTFIEAARTTRNSTLTVGADGQGTMNIINDHSGTVSITLRYAADANNTLADAVLADEVGEKRVGVLTVEDFNGNTLLRAAEAFLDGPPDESYATEEGTRTWTFQALKLTMNTRGSNEAA